MRYQGAVFLAFLIVAFSLGAFLSKHHPRHDSGEPENGIVWETSLKEALEKAKTSHRPVLVDFSAEWCTYCKNMDKTTYRNETLIRLSRKFVCAKIDVDKNPNLAKNFQIQGLPTLVFLNDKPTEVKRLEGYVQSPALVGVMEKLLASR